MLENIAAGASILNAGLSLFSGIMGASASRAEARATASALREEKAWNIGVMRQQRIDQKWSDTMSFWRSGLTLSGETSAAAVVESNQNVLQRAIEHQSRMYDIKISSADAAANRRFLGIF